MVPRPLPQLEPTHSPWDNGTPKGEGNTSSINQFDDVFPAVENGTENSYAAVYETKKYLS